MLTRKHFLAFRYSEPIIGVAWDDIKGKKLECSIENRNTLCVKFETSTFNDDWSGRMEFRFSTPMAQSFQREIKRKKDRLR